jgi:hypothetical protein
MTARDKIGTHIDSLHITSDHRDVTYDPLPKGVAPGKGTADLVDLVQKRQKQKRKLRKRFRPTSLYSRLDRMFFLQEDVIHPCEMSFPPLYDNPKGTLLPTERRPISFSERLNMVKERCKLLYFLLFDDELGF